jgi:LPXTG-motif cell wall-anchored protein
VPTIGGPTTTAPPSTTSPPVLPTPPTDPGPPPPADPSPSPGPAVGGGGGVAGTGVDPAGLPDGRLPRTGTSTWLLALVGFALLAAGGALCRTANRMTRPA